MDPVERRTQLERRLEETRGQLDYLVHNILSADQTTKAVLGVDRSVHDSLLDMLERAAKAMSTLNVTTRELIDHCALNELSLDQDALIEANSETGAAFQDACGVLDRLDRDMDDGDSFVDDMDRLMDGRAATNDGVLGNSLRRLQRLQATVAAVARSTTAFFPSASSSSSSSTTTTTSLQPVAPPAPSPAVSIPASSSSASVGEGSLPSSSLVSSLPASIATAASTGRRSGDLNGDDALANGLGRLRAREAEDDPSRGRSPSVDSLDPARPLLGGTSYGAVSGSQSESSSTRASSLASPDAPSSSVSTTTTTGNKWAKAARVAVPIVGGVVGGVVLGPAGVFLGFKTFAMLSTFAAVGVGVGVISGTAVSLQLADKAQAKEKQQQQQHQQQPQQQQRQQEANDTIQ